MSTDFDSYYVLANSIPHEWATLDVVRRDYRGISIQFGYPAWATELGGGLHVNEEEKEIFVGEQVDSNVDYQAMSDGYLVSKVLLQLLTEHRSTVTAAAQRVRLVSIDDELINTVQPVYLVWFKYSVAAIDYERSGFNGIAPGSRKSVAGKKPLIINTFESIQIKSTTEGTVQVAQVDDTYLSPFLLVGEDLASKIKSKELNIALLPVAQAGPILAEMYDHSDDEYEEISFPEVFTDEEQADAAAEGSTISVDSVMAGWDAENFDVHDLGDGATNVLHVWTGVYTGTKENFSRYIEDVIKTDPVTDTSHYSSQFFKDARADISDYNYFGYTTSFKRLQPLNEILPDSLIHPKEWNKVMKRANKKGVDKANVLLWLDTGQCASVQQDDEAYPGLVYLGTFKDELT